MPFVVQMQEMDFVKIINFVTAYLNDMQGGVKTLTFIPFHEELMLNRLLRPFIAMYWTMKNILSCVFKKKNLRTETIWMMQRYVF